MPLRKARAWLDRFPWKRAGRWAAAGAILVTVAIQLALASSEPGHPRPKNPGAGAANTNPTRAGRADGGLAPAFSEQGVLNGQPLTSARLRGKNVLLFFGRSVRCATCLEQLRSLQRIQRELRLDGVLLVDVTADNAEILRQAVERYRIAAPTISDFDRAMSSAYGALGHGTPAGAGGHTFVLLDRSGRIGWRHDYPMVYVPPQRLLAEIPGIP
jgi:peroxiredoxin